LLVPGLEIASTIICENLVRINSSTWRIVKWNKSMGQYSLYLLWLKKHPFLRYNKLWVWAGGKGPCIDKSAPRFAEQILVNVTASVGLIPAACWHSKCLICRVHISLFRTRQTVWYQVF